MKNKEVDLDTASFMIKLELLRMQPQLFEAIHLGEYKNRYTMKSEIIENDKIRISIESPFFVLSKQKVLEKLGDYISVS